MVRRIRCLTYMTYNLQLPLQDLLFWGRSRLQFTASEVSLLAPLVTQVLPFPLSLHFDLIISAFSVFVFPSFVAVFSMALIPTLELLPFSYFWVRYIAYLFHTGFLYSHRCSFSFIFPFVCFGSAYVPFLYVFLTLSYLTSPFFPFLA